jgi:hypothetical protein
MRQKISFLVATLPFLILVYPQKASACSCLPPPPPDKAFAEAHAVFMGKVVSFKFVENGYRSAKISLVKSGKATGRGG